MKKDNTMKRLQTPLFMLFALLTLQSCAGQANENDTKNDKDSTEIGMQTEQESYDGYVGMSIEFLDRLKAGKSTNEIAARYAGLTFEDLEEGLDTEEKKKAFWLNTYNAFIQHILLQYPERYEDRDEFFKREQVEIAGVLMSFDEIEHGIIRSSKWKLGAGYLPKISPEHVRKLKIDSTDGRIHLALNCGAKSCPEIAIYHEDKVDEELEIIAARYLTKTTKIDGDTVTVTPLMSWFRGDFKGKSGIKEDYLLHYGLISSTDDIELKFGDYDWTLDLGNFTEI